MKAKDIIKEIDPDYYECIFCGRIRHKSKLKFQRGKKHLIECVKRNGCSLLFTIQEFKSLFKRLWKLKT